MKIADNIKCKDFEIIARPSGDRLAGRENVWYYHIYYNGKEIDQKYMATSQTEAKEKISKMVRKVNAILTNARRLEKEGKLEEARKGKINKKGGEEND